MLIDITQLHNIVRTYQREFQYREDTEWNTDQASSQPTADHISLRTEAWHG
jgi:hypothetical protein